MIVPADRPLKARGGFGVLYGNIAPDGAVVKLAGHEKLRHEGTAKVYDGEEACFAAVQAGEIDHGDVVVIRHEGPVGGPGMREMLAITAAIQGRGLGRHGGARHRRALLGRDLRLHGRPRRARSRAGRPDRACCAPATMSSSTSMARSIATDADLSGREPAAPPHRAAATGAFAKYAQARRIGERGRDHLRLGRPADSARCPAAMVSARHWTKGAG